MTVRPRDALIKMEDVFTSRLRRYAGDQQLAGMSRPLGTPLSFSGDHEDLGIQVLVPSALEQVRASDALNRTTSFAESWPVF